MPDANGVDPELLKSATISKSSKVNSNYLNMSDLSDASYKSKDYQTGNDHVINLEQNIFDDEAENLIAL